MPPKALVTGATGLLGREVVKAFEAAGYDVVGTGFKRASPPKILKVDIQDADEVQRLFTEPDSCTKNPEAAKRLNVEATEQLVKAAAATAAVFIYISTDYVFPGVQGQAPYKATDEAKPTNVYGQTKLDGERAALAAAAADSNKKNVAAVVVLRVPVLYGTTVPEDNHQESAVNVLLQSLRKSQSGGEKVKMDDWAIRYPTNTADVGRVCADIAKLYTDKGKKKDDGDDELPRILQFSSEDRMTKYEISQKFAAITGLSTDGLVADKDGGKPGPDGTLRPYDCHLDTSALKELGIDVRTVDFEAWWREKLGV
ncbi:hypothetical protein DV735_g3419, partial [Chaetothyriales sp. CBS 134920]